MTWTYLTPDGQTTEARWDSPRLAYEAAFATDPDLFNASVTCEVEARWPTWTTLTRPQFERLADRLGPEVTTVDEVADLMHAQSWSEEDLFGDLLRRERR